MKLKKNDRLVFFGDSITEWGRNREDETSLGNGYVAALSRILTERFPEANFRYFNRGIGGNHIHDLNNRISDCLDLKPDVVFLLIGINDVWHQVGQKDFGSEEEANRFEAEYRKLLKQLQEAGIQRILLLEPFVLPRPSNRASWRVDLDKKIQVVRKLAQKFQLEFVPLDGLINEEAIKVGAKSLTGEDGVHPTPQGAQFIASEIFKRIEVGK